MEIFCGGAPGSCPFSGFAYTELPRCLVNKPPDEYAVDAERIEPIPVREICLENQLDPFLRSTIGVSTLS